MYDYNTLSPNRKAYLTTALEVFPDIGDVITRDQYLHIKSTRGVEAQWLVIPENRAGRGLYYFPKPTEIHHHTPRVEETDEEIAIRINDTYESMEILVSCVAANTVNSLIVSGGAGIGKSYTVRKVLNNINNGSEYNYVFHSGYIRNTHLFRLLWENRFPGMVIVIDDCDKVLGEEDTLNLLKAALELKPIRRIGWGSEKTFEDSDNEEIPRYFDYEGSIIFLTNKDIRGEIASNTKISLHLSALESRSLILDMKIKTKREYMIKIKQTVNAGMLRNKGFNREQENEIMKFIEDNMNELSELSLRMVEKIAALYRSNHKDWVKLVKATCFK
jgi:hypothetical protein